MRGVGRFPLLRGWWAAVSVVLAVGAGPVHAQTEPPPTLELSHEDRLQAEGFRLREVEYVLDGQRLSSKGEGAPGHWPLTAGRHVLGVRVVYVGHSPVFAYVEGYRFVMRGRVTFDARPGWVVRIHSTGLAHEGLTVQWEQRPAFQLEGEPRRAILSIENGPVEREPLGPDGGVSAEEKTQRLIDEVLAEAQRRAPLETCALEPVYFDFADTRLKPEAEATLRHLSTCLLRQPSLQLRVRGHTDVRGTETINDNLGQGRALTVSGYLQTLGVRREQLMLETEGASQPACPEHTLECYAKSRRVDFLADTGSP